MYDLIQSSYELTEGEATSTGHRSALSPLWVYYAVKCIVYDFQLSVFMGLLSM